MFLSMINILLEYERSVLKCMINILLEYEGVLSSTQTYNLTVN